MEGKKRGPCDFVSLQNFEELRGDCLRKGVLFEDPEFEANDKNADFFLQRLKKKSTFAWKRPQEIVQDPKFFVEGESRFDIMQGSLGDCWLLAAFATLTLHKDLFCQIVPTDQSFKKEEYAGIFHFRFWQFGKWVEVCIDDRLPTVKGRLTSLSSGELNEFWSALLEKAYAKLRGSYLDLDGGFMIEAFEDFTGGLSECYLLDEDAPDDLYEHMLRSYEKGSLMNCGLDSGESRESITEHKLVRGHAFSITKVCMIDVSSSYMTGKVPLVRVRNPWGEETEWNGAWSDKSPQWKSIAEQEKEKIGLIIDDDGEFWISYPDFKEYFDHVDICHVNYDAFGLDTINQSKGPVKLEVNMLEGEFIKGLNTGEQEENNIVYYPHYRLTITEKDPVTVIVALLQKATYPSKIRTRINIYKLNPEDPESTPELVGKCEDPVNPYTRQIGLRTELAAGVYSIVPYTKWESDEGQFILRVFSEKKINLEEYDEDIGVEVVSPTEMKKEDETKVSEVYNNVAGDGGKVDHEKLRKILNELLETELGKKGFSKNTCRSVFGLLDLDGSRKLCFEQFKSFWQDLVKWEEIFSTNSEKGKNQYVRTYKLRKTLKKAGFKLNNRVLKLFVSSYATENSFVTFDDFIVIALKLNFVMGLFEKNVTVKNLGTAAFTLETLVEMMLCC